MLNDTLSQVSEKPVRKHISDVYSTAGLLNLFSSLTPFEQKLFFTTLFEGSEIKSIITREL